MNEKDIDFKSMTLLMVNVLNNGFHAIDKGGLLIIEITYVSPCTATLNLLIFDLAHVCFVKLF